MEQAVAGAPCKTQHWPLSRAEDGQGDDDERKFKKESIISTIVIRSDGLQIYILGFESDFQDPRRKSLRQNLCFSFQL